VDWYVPCDADGYDSFNLVQKLSEPLRRFRNDRWFVLVGSLGRDGRELFRIGTEATYSPKSTATLFCFANDVILAYWNNRGELRLTVTRVA
jgi:hypothetical protein